MFRMRFWVVLVLGWILMFGSCPRIVGAVAADGEDAKQIVQQAVTTELAADRSDRSHWLYFDVDRKPKNSVTQWVAQTSSGDLSRVLEENSRKLSVAEQRAKMDGFVQNKAEQARQRKAGQHDDEQATELLKLLPGAFIWNISQRGRGSTVVLHFKPSPSFRPPDREAEVFAAMEGDMTVDGAQHRIASLKGRLVHDVKFGGGLFAELEAGGSFDVERREVGKTVWLITETHIHIQGHALLFKSIAEQEDEVKTKFQQLPEDVSLQQGEKEILLKSN
jgi:hypothetical protein